MFKKYKYRLYYDNVYNCWCVDKNNGFFIFNAWSYCASFNTPELAREYINKHINRQKEFEYFE